MEKTNNFKPIDHISTEMKYYVKKSNRHEIILYLIIIVIILIAALYFYMRIRRRNSFKERGSNIVIQLPTHTNPNSNSQPEPIQHISNLTTNASTDQNS